MKPEAFIRVCPVCATLAWNGKEGSVETHEAPEITGAAKRKLLENRTFVTVEDDGETQALEEY